MTYLLCKLQVPSTLGPVIFLSWIRQELRELWEGSIPSSHDKVHLMEVWLEFSPSACIHWFSISLYVTLMQPFFLKTMRLSWNILLSLGKNGYISSKFMFVGNVAEMFCPKLLVFMSLRNTQYVTMEQEPQCISLNFFWIIGYLFPFFFCSGKVCFVSFKDNGF